MRNVFNNALEMAIKEHDVMSIYSLFSGLEYGRTSIPVNLYYSAALECPDTQFGKTIRNKIAKSLFAQTINCNYPILKLVSDPNKAFSLPEPHSLLQELDHELSSQGNIRSMMQALGKDDVWVLEKLLDDLDDESKLMEKIMSVLGREFYLFDEIRDCLVSYAVKMTHPRRLLKSHDINLGIIADNLNSLTVEEVFALVFSSDRYDGGAYHPGSLADDALDGNYINDKNALLLLGWILHGDCWDADDFCDWIKNELASDTTSVYRRLMAIKVHFETNGIFGSDYALLFKAFSFIDPAVFSDICEKYEIYPHEFLFKESYIEEEDDDDEYDDEEDDGKEDDDSSRETFFHEVIAAHDDELFNTVLMAIKRQGDYASVVLEMFEEKEKANVSFYQAVENAIRKAIDKHLDSDFIQSFLAQGHGAFDPIGIDPNGTYYIKCLGGDGVAKVEICTDENHLCPALKDFLETYELLLKASGIRDIGFIRPSATTCMTNCNTVLNFKVVGFIGSNYGVKSYYIRNGDKYVKLKVGDIIQPCNPIMYNSEEEFIHFYFTPEMALYAPLG